jgi:hypothetical protein
MAWYVFALVDGTPSGGRVKGLSGPLGLRNIPGGFAVVERRADIPPAEFGSLKRHHDVVAELASRVDAILPVRFGTLLDADAIDEALDERDQEIADAFDVVRGCVQFTWRRAGSRKPEAGSRKPEAGSRKAEAGSRKLAGSGTDYLRRAARAARPAPPAAWRALRVKLAPLVAAERYQPASPPLPETLYHLVPRDKSARYSTMGAGLRNAKPKLSLTGPWPPFAFAPELL